MRCTLLRRRMAWAALLPLLMPAAGLAQAPPQTTADGLPELPPPRVLPEPPPPTAGPDPAAPAPAADLPTPPPGPAPNATASLLGATGFFGGGGFLGAAGFLGGPPVLFTSYRASWFPDQAVTGQPTDLGFARQDFLVSVPVLRTDTDQLTARLTVREENFHTLAILPDTGQPFPQNLWNVQLGAGYNHRFANNWVAGGMLSFGTASDKPFHSINEMTVGVMAFLRVPSGEHNAWLFSLMYSPTAQLAFPVPGIAYFWQPSDQLFATIGLPLQIVYRPFENLVLDASYMLLTTVHAGAIYRVTPQVFLHAAYDWQNESYFLADRTDTLSRLFYYDQQLSAGVRYNFSKHAALDLTTGYVFDRYYFEGRSLSDSHFNRVNVGNGPFGSLLCQFRW